MKMPADALDHALAILPAIGLSQPLYLLPPDLRHVHRLPAGRGPVAPVPQRQWPFAKFSGLL